LQKHGAIVDDCILYHNEPIEYGDSPNFDVVFFASASAVEVFDKLWGNDSLKGKIVVAIGKPTLAAMKTRGIAADVVPLEATVEASFEALATFFVRTALESV
ncbi:MAG: uroporphyrinogen-III synthase, partial [bacterium]